MTKLSFKKINEKRKVKAQTNIFNLFSLSIYHSVGILRLGTDISLEIPYSVLT